MTMVSPPYIRRCSGGTLLAVHAQPNAGRTECAGEHNGRLKVKVAGPPVDGKANKEICRFLAKLCGLSRSRVSIVTGERSREKEILLRDADALVVQKVLSVEGKE